MRSLALAVSCLVAVLVTSSVSAQERPLLAVLDFTGKQAKLSTAEAQALTGIARKQALEILGKKFDLITRENLVDLLKSHGKTLEKCQGECETETGRLIGAELVVSGRITKVFGAYRLEIKAHATSPPKLLAFEEGTSKKRSGLPSAVRRASEALYDSVAANLFGVSEKAKTTSTPAPPAGTAKPATAVQRSEKKTKSPVPARFVSIEPGTFMMGSPLTERGRGEDEGPRHRVKITRGFMLQATEVTESQWLDLMGTPMWNSGSCGSDCPVDGLTWSSALAYANARSRHEGLEQCYDLIDCYVTPGSPSHSCEVRVTAPSGNPLACTGYRLPTEAEWEYAARAGSSGPTYGALSVVAWHRGNSNSQIQEVGRTQPNSWGLYDMLGNVSEWIWDSKYKYPKGAVIDPVSSDPAPLYRVVRGCSCSGNSKDCRVANRRETVPNDPYGHVGFRLARTLPK